MHDQQCHSEAKSSSVKESISTGKLKTNGFVNAQENYNQSQSKSFKMKSIIIGLIYTSTFMGVFFLLSCIGMLWTPTYLEVIRCNGWFMVYTLFIGSWAPVFPCVEYWQANRDYFERMF